MTRGSRKPLQFSLASLFLLVTGAAVFMGTGPKYWLHLGGVVGQVIVAVAGVSLVVGLVLLPLFVIQLLLGMQGEIGQALEVLDRGARTWLAHVKQVRQRFDKYRGRVRDNRGADGP